MAQYNLGTLSSSVVSNNGFTLTPNQPTDTFTFTIANDRNINLYLHNISLGDDADLYLYQDSNYNGVLDASDAQVAYSLSYNNANEVIDYAATAGTYFAQVYRWNAGSTGWVDYDLDLSATYDIGQLSSSVISRDSYFVDANDPTDVFEFTIANDRSINLYLHNISLGDDADLTLYQDSNNNGIFDADDLEVDYSRNGSNYDDVINYQATAGTYFAQVNRYAPGSTDWVTYDLDFAAIYEVGALSGSTISRNGYSVSEAQPTDVFSFTLNNARDIDLYLHNISVDDDADLTLYQDSNNNGVFDASDLEVDSSWNGGNYDDVISYSAAAGTYFVEVSRYASGSTGSVAYDLDLSSSYNLGHIGETPVALDDYTVPSTDPTDLFKFTVGSDRNINISLHDISAGDDVDVRLFSDYNNNGIFDATDEQFGELTGSFDGSNNDDAINFRASAGTYFAQVDRFPGSGNGQYDLDISTTLTGTASNLLPEEVQVGDLDSDRNLYGNISNSNTSDIYSFSLDFYEGVDIYLSGLSNDADIRLIRDYNSNRQVDSGEVVGTSTRGGSLNELISNVDYSGNYYLQVYQYSGSTGYTVTFDRYATSYA